MSVGAKFETNEREPVPVLVSPKTFSPVTLNQRNHNLVDRTSVTLTDEAVASQESNSSLLQRLRDSIISLPFLTSLRPTLPMQVESNQNNQNLIAANLERYDSTEKLSSQDVQDIGTELRNYEEYGGNLNSLPLFHHFDHAFQHMEVLGVVPEDSDPHDFYRISAEAINATDTTLMEEIASTAKDISLERTLLNPQESLMILDESLNIIISARREYGNNKSLDNGVTILEQKIKDYCTKEDGSLDSQKCYAIALSYSLIHNNPEKFTEALANPEFNSRKFINNTIRESGFSPMQVYTLQREASQSARVEVDHITDVLKDPDLPENIEEYENLLVITKMLGITIEQYKDFVLSQEGQDQLVRSGANRELFMSYFQLLFTRKGLASVAKYIPLGIASATVLTVFPNMAEASSNNFISGENQPFDMIQWVNLIKDLGLLEAINVIYNFANLDPKNFNHWWERLGRKNWVELLRIPKFLGPKSTDLNHKDPRYYAAPGTLGNRNEKINLSMESYKESQRALSLATELSEANQKVEIYMNSHPGCTEKTSPDYTNYEILFDAGTKIAGLIKNANEAAATYNKRIEALSKKTLDEKIPKQLVDAWMVAVAGPYLAIANAFWAEGRNQPRNINDKKSISNVKFLGIGKFGGMIESLGLPTFFTVLDVITYLSHGNFNLMNSTLGPGFLQSATEMFDNTPIGLFRISDLYSWLVNIYLNLPVSDFINSFQNHTDPNTLNKIGPTPQPGDPHPIKGPTFSNSNPTPNGSPGNYKP